MNHNFDINIAKEYGIEEAILLQHLYFWIEKNKANNKHFYNDTYWTYNSKKAFANLFPYMTPRKIDYALKNLIDKGLIITGNFNENATNRTLWYALTKMGYCILQNCEMEQTKLLNDINNINNINNINTDNKPNINKENCNNSIITNKESLPQVLSDVEVLFNEFWKAYPRKDNKKTAFTRFKKIKNLKNEFPNIMNTLELFKQSKQWQDLQYVPMASTWLNQERWKDETLPQQDQNNKWNQIDMSGW